MDSRIAKLKTPQQCERFAKNAIEKDRPDLADEARKHAVELRADALNAKTDAEKEALRAVYAYEEVLSQKNGKRTRASRTWQMIDRHGIIEAVERAVNRPTETQGYNALVEMGLEEFAFEAVILRHPELFSKEAVLRSKDRMRAWKTADDIDSTARSDGLVLTTIQDQARIAEAQSLFERRVRDAATKSGVITLGYQGGGRDAQAYHVASSSFWVAFEDSGNRYWNALGLGNPFDGETEIIAEINPPKSGIDRNIAGVFAENKGGEIWIAHRGKIGGGRKGIGKNAFFEWYPEPLDLVFDVDRHLPMIIVGSLNDLELISKLVNFTERVAAFKIEATTR
jgi:hypothetical protein